MKKELEIYEQLLNEESFKEINPSFISYFKYMNEKSKNLSNQITLNEFISEINYNKDLLINSLENIKIKYITNIKC